jgi:hypothetical protein
LNLNCFRKVFASFVDKKQRLEIAREIPKAASKQLAATTKAQLANSSST